MQPIHFRISFLAIGLLLFLAIADLDYFFYNFLRAIVTIGGVLLIYRAYKTKQYAWYLVAGVAILLFNRWFGFESTKATWIPIDLAFGLLFIGAAIHLGKPHKIDDYPPEGMDNPRESVDADNSKPQETKKFETNRANPWKVIGTIAAILLVLYGMWGREPSASSCETYFQDPRGGYCA